MTVVFGNAYVSIFNGGLRPFEKLKIQVMPAYQCACNRVPGIIPT